MSGPSTLALMRGAGDGRLRRAEGSATVVQWLSRGALVPWRVKAEPRGRLERNQHPSVPAKRMEQTTRTLTNKPVPSCCWCLTAYTSPAQTGRESTLFKLCAVRSRVGRAVPNLPPSGEADTQPTSERHTTPLSGTSHTHRTVSSPFGRGVSGANIGGAHPRTGRGFKGIRGCPVEQLRCSLPFWGVDASGCGASPVPSVQVGG